MRLPSSSLFASGLLALALAFTLPSTPAQAVSVVAGDAQFTQTSFSGSPTARYRLGDSGGNSTWELSVGTAPGSGVNENTANLGYVPSASFSVLYDFSDITGTYAPLTGPATEATFAAGDLPGFNAIRVQVIGPNYQRGVAPEDDPGPEYFRFSDVMLNGALLPDGFQDLRGSEPPASRAFTTFYIYDLGLPLDASYEVSGTLEFFGDGLNLRDEVARVEVSFGSVEVIPLPAAVWMLLAGVAGLGLVARRKRSAA